jgi:hypothetical protein
VDESLALCIAPMIGAFAQRHASDTNQPAVEKAGESGRTVIA